MSPYDWLPHFGEYIKDAEQKKSEESQMQKDFAGKTARGPGAVLSPTLGVEFIAKVREDGWTEIVHGQDDGRVSAEIHAAIKLSDPGTYSVRLAVVDLVHLDAPTPAEKTYTAAQVKAILNWCKTTGRSLPDAEDALRRAGKWPE